MSSTEFERIEAVCKTLGKYYRSFNYEYEALFSKYYLENKCHQMTINEMSSHEDEPPIPLSFKNALKDVNIAESTKPALNSSASVFIPKGHSNKASSKCKVMTTITEQHESLPDVQCTNGNDNMTLLIDATAGYYHVPSFGCHNNRIPRELSKSVSVSKRFTQNIIPHAISDQIHDIYRYMDKSMGFDMNKLLCKDKKTVIINFGFHEKGSNEPLFCIIKKQKSGKKEWGMTNQLFTAKMIEDKYGMPRDKLPSSLKQIHGFNFEALQTYQFSHDILNKTQWHKTPIYDKVNNKQRRVLHLTKAQFIKAIKDKIRDAKNILPIVTCNDGKPCVENVMIMDLMEDTSIGISYSLDQATKKLKITGIHLDKDELLIQHKMASLHDDCHCLDNFSSNIDDLKIGNTYNEQNQINALRKENKKLRDENKNPLIKYIKKVLSDLGGLISDNIDASLSAIKQIFTVDKIKEAINNQNRPISKPKKISSTITTNITTSSTNTTDTTSLNASIIPISYLTTICGSYATTAKLNTLPPPPLNAALRSIPEQQ